jgi:DNA helicase-2/ATP-dependent DNA helicase PcrA
MTDSELAARLNPEQFAAVTGRDLRSLVLAGAGSGKTRTLVHRVAWLLAHGTGPERILLLTFTNKAAREMMERVGALVHANLRALWGGTFHSIANRLLRRHAREAGYSPSFSILDREDQHALIKEIIREPAKGRKDFPRPAVLSELFGLSANTGVPVERLLETRFGALLPLADEILSAARRYTTRKRESDAMDFDDLLAEGTRLLREHDEIARAYRARFCHLLVDEFQDTNRIQSEFIALLSGPDTALMAVGDDAQAIYSWRGADPANLRRFATDAGCVVHRVELNYRSVPEILAVANAVIQGGGDAGAEDEDFAALPKELRAHRPAAGRRPLLATVLDPSAQARFVAAHVCALVDEGFAAEEIAVLYRAHFHAMELQMELTRQGIPFRVTSGVRFFEQAHVKDVVAFLRFAANPRDEVAFRRIAGMIPGVGEGTAGRLWQTLSGADLLRADLRGLLWDCKVPPKGRKSWEQVAHTLDEIRPGGTLLAPDPAIGIVVEAVVEEHLKSEYTNHEERREDLDALRVFASGFDQTQEFLAQLALLGDSDAEPEEGTPVSDRICLSSIHQAKGLEWRAVFVIGLNERMFPTGRSIDDPAALAEERRLFYVAVTRAMDRLLLVRPMFQHDRQAGLIYGEPSRFLSGLDDEVDRLDEA